MHEREYKREGERLQRHDGHDQLYVRNKRVHAVGDPRDQDVESYPPVRDGAGDVFQQVGESSMFPFILIL